jgi:acyl transferase domain-containing protein
MDPQQRLLLEVGYSTLHKSAMRLSSLMGENACMTVGVEEPEWQQVKQMVPSLQRAAYGMGDAMSVVAGRLSCVFGCHGLCTSVDAACASALCALQSTAATCAAVRAAVVLRLE